MARVLRRAVKALKWTALGGVAGGTVVVLHRNEWDVSSIGAVRIGRAALCVIKSYLIIVTV